MIDMPRPGAARSFWLQEALTHDPGEPTQPPHGLTVASRLSANKPVGMLDRPRNGAIAQSVRARP